MAMYYELEVLEDLVFETLHPKRIIQAPIENAQLVEFNKMVVSESDSVPKKIRKAISRILKEEKRVVYLQLQQAGITRMLDAVYHYLMPKDISCLYKQPKTDTVDSVYILLYTELESIFVHLRQGYGKYFDHDAKLPDGYKWKMEPFMNDTLDKVSKALKRKLNPTLLELVCEPFKHFLLIDTECSNRDLIYLKKFQEYMLSIAEHPPEKVEDRITERLLYLNFNSVLFFNYYILKMSEEASLKKTISERVEYFSWQIKVINQTPVKPYMTYLRHLPPIRDQLVFWIAEDLYYLDKKHQLSLSLPVNREVEKDKLKKLHVQLTVADLALGARLLLDTEIIVNINYTELMKIVAKGFRTNRQANISQQAIYNVGFESSVTSKEKVKQLLMKMVRKIGEY